MKQPDVTMKKLVGPIMAENLLRMALSSIDILMLSMYSDQAVAAVGLSKQFAMFLMLLYNVVAIGGGIVLAQALGAHRLQEASQISTASLTLAALFGATLSLLMALLAAPILTLYSLEPLVRDYAWQYMIIFGSGSIFLSFNLVQANILRTCGHSRDAMATNIAANLINIVGNWIAIRGLNLGIIQIPVTGVIGVATATVFSQASVCLIFTYLIKKRGHIHIDFRRLLQIPARQFKRVLSVGVPTAGEGLAYNIAQIILMNMAAGLGTAAMSAWIYNITITRFVFVAALSIGVSTQIQVGHLVGAGKTHTAYHKVYRYYLAGLSVSVVLVLLVNIFRHPLLGIFTSNPIIITMASQLMLISILLEIGRASNLIIIHALKGAGDVRFPILIGMASMWGIGVLGGYTMGIQLGLGIAGIWAGVAFDEFTRGIIMLLRWKSKAWTTKAIVTPADETPQEYISTTVSPIAATVSGSRTLEDVEVCSYPGTDTSDPSNT